MICCENASSENLKMLFLYVRYISNVFKYTLCMLIQISHIYLAASCSKQLQNV